MHWPADWSWYDIATSLSTLAGFVAFVAVIFWAFWRPQAEIEAESRLWMEDEKVP